MTFYERRIAKRFAKKIAKKAIQDWLFSDKFDEWFWDRAYEYAIREDEEYYIFENLTKWVDRWFKV